MKYTVYRKRPSGTFTKLSEGWAEWLAYSPEEALRNCLGAWSNAHAPIRDRTPATFLVGWIGRSGEEFQEFKVCVPGPQDYIVEAV